MVFMTTDTIRDHIGRFAPLNKHEPEMTLDSADDYEDDGTGDFDIHAFYDTQDALQRAATDADNDDLELVEDWLAREAENRQAPEAIDEYFNRPEPDLTEATVTVGAWGSAPF